jgi:hypothetical protein
VGREAPTRVWLEKILPGIFMLVRDSDRFCRVMSGAERLLSIGLAGLNLNTAVDLVGTNMAVINGIIVNGINTGGRAVCRRPVTKTLPYNYYT